MAEKTYNIGKSVYTAHKSGMYFNEKTPDSVRNLLALLHATGEPVRLFYGDTSTGRAWAEENDVTGRIGCSMGPCKVALLVAPRATGGGSVLDSCIVAVMCKGQFVYAVPGFTVGDWQVAPSDMQGYAEIATHNGQVHARFKKPGKALRFCQFMRGERMSA